MPIELLPDGQFRGIDPWKPIASDDVASSVIVTPDGSKNNEWSGTFDIGTAQTERLAFVCCQFPWNIKVLHWWYGKPKVFVDGNPINGVQTLCSYDPFSYGELWTAIKLLFKK